MISDCGLCSQVDFISKCVCMIEAACGPGYSGLYRQGILLTSGL